MFALFALVAFIIAAILCFVATSVTLTVVVGIIAIGLACLAAHLFRPWNPI